MGNQMAKMQGCIRIASLLQRAAELEAMGHAALGRFARRTAARLLDDLLNGGRAA